jgi:ABC-type multidrug transport system ATPase subunit
VSRTLGYLPQEFGVYPKVSAQELLDHFALLEVVGERRERKEVVEALLRQVNLWDVRKQKLGGYSGGMKQRFGVAVALLGNPKLMIVDEPTAGLDPAERVRFLNLLSELGENSVVLLSTHIVDDVSELCTRMAIIDQGEILLEAEPLRAVDELRGRIWRRILATLDGCGRLPSVSGGGSSTCPGRRISVRRSGICRL